MRDDDDAVGFTRVQVAVTQGFKRGDETVVAGSRDGGNRCFRLLVILARQRSEKRCRIVLCQSRGSRNEQQKEREKPGDHDGPREIESVEWSAAWGNAALQLKSAHQLPWPPHLPVEMLKFPQASGFLQSEISTADSGR